MCATSTRSTSLPGERGLKVGARHYRQRHRRYAAWIMGARDRHLRQDLARSELARRVSGLEDTPAAADPSPLAGQASNRCVLRCDTPGICQGRPHERKKDYSKQRHWLCVRHYNALGVRTVVQRTREPPTGTWVAQSGPHRLGLCNCVVG